jgi:curli biogenesis system outer membrane secretion channel CsgG
MRRTHFVYADSRFVATLAAAVVLLSSLGCFSSAPAPVNALGEYRPAPETADKPKVAVASMKVEGDAPSGATVGTAGANLGDVAADEMAKLMEKAGRVQVVPRTKLGEMLSQANAADALRPGALVRPVSLNGVDYVLVGTITNLSVTKRKETSDTWQKMKHWVEQSSSNRSVSVTTSCGVGFNLIDPATGDVVLSNNSEFNYSGPAVSLGLDVLAAESSSPGVLPVTDEDRVQVIRLALDDAIHKSLPKTDRFLASRHGATPPASTAPALAATTAPVNSAAAAGATTPAPPSAPTTSSSVTTANPSAAKKICPTCGAENAATAKFCRQCGAKL